MTILTAAEKFLPANNAEMRWYHYVLLFGMILVAYSTGRENE